MNTKSLSLCLLTLIFSCSIGILSLNAQVPIVPPTEELNSPFGQQDERMFGTPSKVYYPETWFHYIAGNVSKEGTTADLEAIAAAGFSGIQLFHGQFNNDVWPGVGSPITCLSPLWDETIKHAAEECRRLGLRFTMLDCPGWSMAGGPWIEPSNSIRHLVWSRMDITEGSHRSNYLLPMPQPSDEDWRDYKEVAVLAFPTPLDDTNEPLHPIKIDSNRDYFKLDWIQRKSNSPLQLAPTTADDPHWLEVTLEKNIPLRTLELPCINSYVHSWCYEPGVSVTVQAVMPNGDMQQLIQTDLPQSNWQDDRSISLACPEVKGVNKYRIAIINKHHMTLGHIRLYSAARKNNWESEAGWTLRTIERNGELPHQSVQAFIPLDQILDLSDKMDASGRLNWEAPEGNWTILRIGNVNTGMRNGPAPPEGTGWECNKLSTEGSTVQFNNYIGRLCGNDGPLDGGLLNGMLFDSWECKTQTWTADMEKEFGQISGYPLRKWLPAVFGYVIDDHETTTRFLRDWRSTINDLFVENFFGNMSRLAKEHGLNITYETAAGDVFPTDMMEYFKYADVPMCEFWQPFTDGYVGSLNFKPIKPTASAARMYGKPRVAAEAFTSFTHTWDEHLYQLKEIANVNSIEGVSHLIFHTYTHNPQVGFLPPGTSFGGQGIGTPFLRGQTWWKHVPAFNAYHARCSYLLERGKPVSDVLWYVGDEMDHKPDQNAPFPEGYKYDYCNPEALLHRLSVDEEGMIVTPEQIRYKALWIPENRRMLPETLERLYALVREGATVVGNAPREPATLRGGKTTQKRFNTAVRKIWGKTSGVAVRKVGRGSVLSGISLSEALTRLNIRPDVTGGNVLWSHRQIKNADWYFVCSPKGGKFQGTLNFRSTGKVELWDPETGVITPVDGISTDGYTSVALDLPYAGSCFVVFRNDLGAGQVGQIGKRSHPKKEVSTIPLNGEWTLAFPSGWGAPASLQITELKAWKDLDVSAEAKAFSGTVTYTTEFDMKNVIADADYRLHLGQVDMIAVVKLNGKELRTVWAPPYQADLTSAIRPGRNRLTIEVTSSWFNRLVYDAKQPAEKRKTWVIRWPDGNASLRSTGLLGPVVVKVEK